MMELWQLQEQNSAQNVVKLCFNQQLINVRNVDRKCTVQNFVQIAVQKLNWLLNQVSVQTVKLRLVEQNFARNAEQRSVNLTFIN